MLRTALLVFAVLLTLLGIGGLVSGYVGWAPAIWGVGLLACVIFERRRYTALPPAAGGNWQPTGEQFIDSESGRATEVLYDPETGERRYVPLRAGDEQTR
jgi:hypothetical protein